MKKKYAWGLTADFSCPPSPSPPRHEGRHFCPEWVILPPGGFFIQTSTGLCRYGVSKTAEDLTVAKIFYMIDDLVPVANVLKIIAKVWENGLHNLLCSQCYDVDTALYRENLAISAWKTTQASVTYRVERWPAWCCPRDDIYRFEQQGSYSLPRVWMLARRVSF